MPARPSLPLALRHPVVWIFPTCSASSPVIITLGPFDPARSTITLSQIHCVLLTSVRWVISFHPLVLVVVVCLRFRGGNCCSGRSGNLPEVTQLFGGRAGARSLVPPCPRCACCPDLCVCAVCPVAVGPGGSHPHLPSAPALLCLPRDAPCGPAQHTHGSLPPGSAHLCFFIQSLATHWAICMYVYLPHQ